MKLLKAIALLSLLSNINYAFANPTAFGHESKASYIDRCVKNGEMPNQTDAQKRAFCSCFAEELESGYDKVVSSISPTDSVAKAQKKFNSAAQEFAKSCM